jgi:3-methyladenine DNA glycosylase/8-oxoguanine DNA glycosylase
LAPSGTPRRANKEKANEQPKAWRASNYSKIRAYRLLYDAQHREQIRAEHRQRRARYRSIAQVRQSPEEVYRLAIAALPSGLPRFIRDDVVSSPCLAILEGQINVVDMTAKAKEFLRAYNREFDTFQTLSLDARIPGTKTTYLDALVAG